MVIVMTSPLVSAARELTQRIDVRDGVQVVVAAARAAVLEELSAQVLKDWDNKTVLAQYPKRSTKTQDR